VLALIDKLKKIADRLKTDATTDVPMDYPKARGISAQVFQKS
jgi:hypothetical protein